MQKWYCIVFICYLSIHSCFEGYCRNDLHHLTTVVAAVLEDSKLRPQLRRFGYNKTCCTVPCWIVAYFCSFGWVRSPWSGWWHHYNATICSPASCTYGETPEWGSKVRSSDKGKERQQSAGSCTSRVTYMVGVLNGEHCSRDKLVSSKWRPWYKTY